MFPSDLVILREIRSPLCCSKCKYSFLEYMQLNNKWMFSLNNLQGRIDFFLVPVSADVKP